MGVRGCVLLVLVLCGCGVFCGSALGVETHPGWGVTSSTFPTYLAPSGGTGAIEVNVYNNGGEASSGTVTVTDTLPAGIVASEAGDVQNGFSGSIGEKDEWECTGNGASPAPSVEGASVVTCTNVLANLPVLPTTERVGTGNEAGSGSIEHIAIAIKTEPGAVTGENRVTVAGGGALAPASTSGVVTVSSTPVPPVPAFGFQDMDGWFSNADGTLDTQAGSHPFELAISFDLNTIVDQEGELRPAGGNSRNLVVNLPPGFIGNPTAVPQCPRQQFDSEECNPSTQVGVNIPEVGGGKQVPERLSFPVYNLVPPAGVPAQFGFVLAGIQVFIDANVRSGSDYGITAHVSDIPQTRNVMGDRTILWGEPSDPLHNPYRYSNEWEHEKCGLLDPEAAGCPSTAPRIPFLTLPTACSPPSEAPAFSASLDTWETEGFGEDSFALHDNNDARTGITGCDHLTFGPSISAAPDTGSTDTPAGLTVSVRAPQEGLSTPGALTTSDIKDTRVTLPGGMGINPGQAAGLQACQYSESGIGVEPTQSEPSRGEPDCPNASKVGTDEAETPILFKPLKGNVYVLPSNPPHLKLLAGLSGEGVTVKLILNVELNEQTGQISTTVENVPQAPVNNFKISFSGGAQAALDTPKQCGEYTTSSDFTPWSTPILPDVFPSSTFAIGSGTDGAACPSSPASFSPSLIAGATTDQAGAFTKFSTLIQIGDDQQRVHSFQFKLPKGLLAALANATACPEPQAEEGTCPEASKIGHATVASGPGPYPLVVPQPGEPEAKIYLTGPYEGAPFGLSIVTPVLVGPFNLGVNVVRAKIEVDPVTATVTITTYPSGPHAIPQILHGVHPDLRTIDAVIERADFIVNPTNCNPQEFSGTAYSAEGASAPITHHFQVGSCQSLKFNPTFTATASGKVTKKYGTNLTLKSTLPAGPAGQQANYSRVKIELPKQLPSRLTTLQKACTSAQFNANPANCPPASVVGHVKVLTPLLSVPLEGPAYFVSHGGEAFPNLVFLLQGDNLMFQVTSDTFISKAGITTGSLKTVPDAPVTSFELTLPSGPYSVFTGLGNLCTEKPKMPVAFVAQNGLELHQNININITSCTKTRTLTRTQKLTAALKTCRKNKNKNKRTTCETQAHKKYGNTKTTKKHNNKK